MIQREAVLLQQPVAARDVGHHIIRHLPPGRCELLHTSEPFSLLLVCLYKSTTPAYLKDLLLETTWRTFMVRAR